ncbi:MAG TPA: acetate--CoA ligase [Steroidobacteraceae bacterium]|jgi:acetyl-CoA synthetase|nr:acetate--CoA ligase [Steroidobacteraceae bacterium]
MASKNIVSVLQEERTFAPGAEFTSRSRLKPADLERLRRQAAEDANGFWAQLARQELTWHKPFTVTLDDSAAPNYRWFTDGRLNVSFNCLDVHLAERGQKTAILFEGEPGDTRRLSYRELHAEVCRFANALKAQGIRKGDRVAIYMPLVPETVVAMHACNRIGAIHSVVFGGFSAPALKDRIEDTGAKMLITADGGWRGGHPIELKAAADKALAEGCKTIERVIVLERTGRAVSMRQGRDLWWHEILAGQSPHCEPEWVEAEHPLYLLYTSGSTGKPKGIQHSSGGYLLGAKLTTQWVFDLRDDDVFWCTADVGWVTGHSYVAYGPLAAGATVVLYEGAPTTPDGGRFWKICQDHGVSVFYTAPTAIRALMKLGDEMPARYDLSRLRLLGSVGEPINPEAWMWYQRVIGRGRCPIVDTWWQTETGAILISPLPGVTPTKPGSCTLPLPGIEADIVDERGESVTRSDAGGYLVIKKPWPSMLRTIWGNNARYLAAYWEKFDKRFYVAGDSARRDKDGYFWIMGRIDDVLNVAGHRLGTMEIESALVSHARVAEAAVVGKPHEIKGEAVFAYVVCRGPRPTGDTSALVNELRTWVAEHLGAIAKPDEIRFADNLPKTRSGKIMRRLLRAIARGEEISQDVSTLENPAILEQLRGADAPAAAKPSATPGRPAAATRPRPGAAKSARRTQSGARGATRRPAAPKSRAGKSAKPPAKAKTRAATKRKAAASAQGRKRGGSRAKTAARRAPVKRAVKSQAPRRAGRKARTRR